MRYFSATLLSTVLLAVVNASPVVNLSPVSHHGSQPVFTLPNDHSSTSETSTPAILVDMMTVIQNYMDDFSCPQPLVAHDSSTNDDGIESQLSVVQGEVLQVCMQLDNLRIMVPQLPPDQIQSRLNYIIGSVLDVYRHIGYILDQLPFN